MIAADLADEKQVVPLLDEVTEMELDLLVNNAALAHYMPFAELPLEAAQTLVRLNVLTPILLTRAVVPRMIGRKTGAIVNVASLLAFSGGWENPQLPRRAVYAASKSFLVTSTQVLASELRDTGVRVQVVCPGVVRTEFHSRQGIDLSAVPRMDPTDVVTASLHDLERGIVVSIPGASHESTRCGYSCPGRVAGRYPSGRVTRSLRPSVTRDVRRTASPVSPPVIVYAVVDDALSPDFPLAPALA